jgi:hypothetical protein
MKRRADCNRNRAARAAALLCEYPLLWAAEWAILAQKNPLFGKELS